MRSRCRAGLTRAHIPFILVGIVAIGALYGIFKWWQVEQAVASRSQAVRADAEVTPVTDFELTERGGNTFRSAEMRGKVWVATYFFTTCPGSCIRLNQNIQFMHNLPDLADVTWVSITCDPDTDTLPALSEYADRYSADPRRWLFCRGDLDYVKQIGLGMHLDVYRRGHKDYAVVFDKAGKIRGMFDATRKSQAARLRTMLLECLEEELPAEVADASQPQTPSS